MITHKRCDKKTLYLFRYLTL